MTAKQTTPPSSSDRSYLQDIASFVSDPVQRKLAADCSLVGYNGSVMVHKFVLCARSKVFRKMIDSNPSRQTLPLNQYSTKVLEALVNFIYADNLPPEEVMEDVEAELLQIAEQFQLDKLKLICEKSIESHVHF